MITIVHGLTDYCSICGPGKQHIACEKADDSWGSSCPADRYLVDLNEEEVALFVDRHNFFRNKIALGKETGFSPASLMATIYWDEELAYLAELNVSRVLFHIKYCVDWFFSPLRSKVVSKNVMNVEQQKTFIELDKIFTLLHSQVIFKM